MPSVIQKKSYNSVKVFWLNRELLVQNLNKSIKALTDKRKEIRKIILFGSMAEGRFSVSSDLDLIIIISESHERFIDRPLKYIDFFEDVGVGVDIFVYTEKEAKTANIPLLNTALDKGEILFSR